jgi:protein arginine N-methyltransferase 1
MYELADYGEMILDRVRLDAFAEALRRQVAPGAVVADIGAGTGILSLLACKLGARRVYAIEPSDAALLIHEAARDNGYADRITVLQQRSTDLDLPERADVIVSDLRGAMPAFGHHLADIIDARTRLLIPGGCLIARADTLHAAVVAAPEPFEKRRSPWTKDVHGLELGCALRYVQNNWNKHRAQPDALLSSPQVWARIEYQSVSDPRVCGRGTHCIEKDAVAHGLLAWFDTELCEGVGFSNAPGAPEVIYGQAFYPWPEAVSLHAGDRVDFELRADPGRDGYVWTWSSTIHAREAPEVAVHRFRQSDFLRAPLSKEAMSKRAASFTPTLSPIGEIARGVLERFRAGIELQTLAGELCATHPRQFRSFEAALDFVSDLSARYSG